MIIKLKSDATQEEIEKLISKLKEKGLQISWASSSDVKLFGVIGDTSSLEVNTFLAYRCVDMAQRVGYPFKRVSRAFHPEDTIIEVGNLKIGGNNPLVVIGGPCSVESKESVTDIAINVKEAGGHALRGGAYKPRTSPYAFQGMATEGILAMVHAKEVTGLPIVSELMSSDKIEEFEKYVDIIQIGARNMQNFELLKEVGKRTTKPILLKRGLANTIEEWLMSAEYIIANGNPKVILCERGIRTFEKYTRNTLDLSVIPLVKKLTHLPIIIDPSHATGKWDLVESMSLAAIAAGCDGLIIEVHNDPEHAMSDGQQCLKYDNFASVIEKGRKIAQVIGRDI